MLLPSTAWLSMISTLNKRYRTTTQAIKNRFQEACKDSGRGFIIGHNIISYDLPVIRKLYPWFDRPGLVVDTLLLSRLYHADMMSWTKSISGMGCH